MPVEDVVLEVVRGRRRGGGGGTDLGVRVLRPGEVQLRHETEPQGHGVLAVVGRVTGGRTWGGAYLKKRYQAESRNYVH